MQEFKDFLDSIYPIKQETWSKLEQLFKLETIKKGEYFVKEGETTYRFAFLRKGIVRAFYTNDTDKEYTKQFFVFPSIIGSYSSLITQKPSLFSQQALSDCEILYLDYGQLVKLYDSAPDLERLGRRFAENYFVANESKEIELALHNADIRYLKFKKKFPKLEQLIPQYHIASYLGVSPTQLSRIRKKSYKS